MIVCSCRLVSDRLIRQRIDAGASTVDEVLRQTGAGSDCGACLLDIRRMLRGERPGPLVSTPSCEESVEGVSCAAPKHRVA